MNILTSTPSLTMYKIECKDKFLLRQISGSLNYFDIPIVNIETKCYGQIFLESNKNKIDLNFQNIQKSFFLPCRVIELVNEIKIILLDHYIKFDSLFYYPMRQILSSNISSLKLRHIHNIIIEEILKNFDHQMSKEYLYKCIWPNDHEVQLNKLDTHLTNLKNTLRDSLNYNLIFKSVSGNIKFLIN